MSPVLDYTHANADLLAGYKHPHLFRRVCLATYYPPFRERILEAKAKAAERGVHYWSEYGYRSIPLQNQLHAAYLAGKGGKAAPGGFSSHNFGLGDDSTHDSDPAKPGLQPDWEPAHYDVLGEELARVGLDWGKRYGDLPHANLAGYTYGTELAPLLAGWNGCPAGTPDDERLRAVWAFLDARPSVLVPPYEPKP